ncbi:MAG: BlaI/MecI/CopY family transcriptional regulator, partial [Planctomycetota bacterium]
MDVLWKRGPISVREIVESLYSEHTPSLHATVKSLLDRLAEKGCVTCDASQFAHRFSASIDRKT